MMYRSLTGMSCLIASLVSVSANAAEIDFGLVAPTTGTLSYTNASTSLIGTGIDVDNVAGLDTPANDGTAIACSNCVLEFTTGANTGGWDFGSGGTISITGGVPAASIADGATLLSGTFNSATVVDVGGGAFNFKIAGGSFLDTKHPDLLTYFDMPDGDYQGGLNLSFNTIGAPQIGDFFTSDSLFSGDIVNSPVPTTEPIPLPAAFWLFGSGLLGLAGIARRKDA